MLCPVCKASIRTKLVSSREELHCGRCSHVLIKGHRTTTLQPAVALSITGLFLVILANAYPIMIFEVAGNSQENRIITGVLQLGDQGYWPIAILVFFSAICAPALYFSSIFYVSLACCLRKRFPLAKELADIVEVINAWNLVPVFAIACLAAVVKLKLLGTVHWRSGMLWIALLSLCSILLSQAFDKNLVVERLKNLR